MKTPFIDKEKIRAVSIIAFLLSSHFFAFISIPAFSQNVEWVKHAGSNVGVGNEHGYGICSDKSGNVFITGSYYNNANFDTALVTGTGQDIFLAKYSSEGKLLWVKKGDGASNSQGNSVVTDSAGNCYITGGFISPATFDTATITGGAGTSIFIAKYNSSGKLKWVKGIATNGGMGWGLVVSHNNLYFSGGYGGTTNFDTIPFTGGGGFIANLDMNSGNVKWAKKAGEMCYGLSNDAAGNVYSTGYFQNTVDFDPGAGTFNLTAAGSHDIYILKLTGSGNFMWAKKIGGTTYDDGHAIVTDTAGNVFTTGYFQGTVDFDPGVGIFNLTSVGTYGIFISKLDASGNFVWAKKLGGTGANHGYSIATDPAGNVYTTGDFQGTADFDPGVGTYNLISNGFGDVFISKLDANGNFVWAKAMGGTAGDAGNTIAADAGSNIYFIGDFQNAVVFEPGICKAQVISYGGSDIFFAKYNQANPLLYICMSTVDSVTSSKNILFWDKTPFSNVDTFNIYREIGSVYVLIGKVPYANLSMFIDSTNGVDPKKSSYRYKLSLIYSNGSESVLSLPHETMWLQVTQPLAPALNLTWTDYCGFPVLKYYIWRDSIHNNNWQKIDSVLWGTNTYIDSFPPNDTAMYRIESVSPAPCAVTRTKDPEPNTTTVKTTKSNSSDRLDNPVGVSSSEEQFQLNVYPNPSTGQFTTISQLTIRVLEIYNLYGEKVHSESINRKSYLANCDLSNGIYFVKVITDKGASVKKIVISR